MVDTSVERDVRNRLFARNAKSVVFKGKVIYLLESKGVLVFLERSIQRGFAPDDI